MNREIAACIGKLPASGLAPFIQVDGSKDGSSSNVRKPIAHCMQNDTVSTSREKLHPLWRSVAKAKYNNLLTRLGIPIGKRTATKKKLLILGTGWATVSFLPFIDLSKYEVTVVSPKNYFSFTPFLPAACVGTLSPRACLEPVRQLITRGGKQVMTYYEAEATEIDLEKKFVVCQKDGKNEFNLAYDLIVVSVGAQSDLFNTPGAQEHSFVLKDAEHAGDIRSKLLYNLEKAVLPNTSDKEREQLLHFVVVGGGPTGIETAAEMSDFIHTEVAKHFPTIAHQVRISLIELLPRTLPTFSRKASDFSAKNLDKMKVNILLQHRVTKVEADSITVQSCVDGSTYSSPAGMIIWAPGNAPVKFTNQLKKKLSSQPSKGPLRVDAQLRVKGAEQDSFVYALGDCAKVSPPLMHTEKTFVSQLYEESESHPQKASTEFLKGRVGLLSMTYPQMMNYKPTEEKSHMTLKEFTEELKAIDGSYVAPWASAQFAKQEAQYLARVFNQLDSPTQRSRAESFIPNWQGSLAYVGQHQAVADFPGDKTLTGGILSILLWKAVYLQMQLSLRTGTYVVSDWIRTYFGGRDVVKEQSALPNKSIVTS